MTAIALLITFHLIAMKPGLNYHYNHLLNQI
jgi:hypothetical protein